MRTFADWSEASHSRRAYSIPAMKRSWMRERERHKRPARPKLTQSA
jgi:hypothetical protein